MQEPQPTSPCGAAAARSMDRLWLLDRARKLAADPEFRRIAEESKHIDWSDPDIPRARDVLEEWLASQPPR